MKLSIALLASAALAFAAPTPLAAEPAAQPDTVDPSTPTQLPRTAIPHRYFLTITPHAERLTFDANVEIDLQVIKSTATLTFNAADLTFASAGLRNDIGDAGMSGTVTTDAAAQTATVSFPGVIRPGNYRLLSSFEYATVDSAIMAHASTQSVKIADAHDTQQDLDLYLIP